MYIYFCIKNVIKTNCLSILSIGNINFLLNKKDSVFHINLYEKLTNTNSKENTAFSLLHYISSFF